MSDISKAASALEDLGFTGLEASIYAHLLRSGAQSGYRVAQLTGKAAANTYRALESLEARGAVICEDGESRLYRAVPYAELVAMISSDFGRRAERATRAFASLERETGDDRIYRLSRPEHVYERARSLIDATREVLLVDAFPDALQSLSEHLEAAAARGVAVIIRSYAPVALAGVVAVETPHGQDVRERWPGTWLNLVSDGLAMMIAHITAGDAEATGMSSQNPFLSWTYHSSLRAEIAIAHLQALALRDPKAPLARALTEAEALVPGDAGRSRVVQHMRKKQSS
jgi:hypothetical protein